MKLVSIDLGILNARLFDCSVRLY